MQIKWRRFVAQLLGSVFLASVVVSPCRAGPQDMLTLMQRITALAREGRYGEAVTLARKLESEAERTTGRQSPMTATTLVVLGQVLQTQGETAEAEALLRRALAIREKSLGPNHPDVAAVLATLGQIEFGQNRLKDAERDVSRAISIDETALGPDQYGGGPHATRQPSSSPIERGGGAGNFRPLARRLQEVPRTGRDNGPRYAEQHRGGPSGARPVAACTGSFP